MKTNEDTHRPDKTIKKEDWNHRASATTVNMNTNTTSSGSSRHRFKPRPVFQVTPQELRPPIVTSPPISSSTLLSISTSVYEVFYDLGHPIVK